MDFGTGDGTYVVRSAQVEPDVLFLGVDAIADNLRAASRRPPGNAIFGRLALADAPGELAAIADRLTVLFPWGSLLAAVSGVDPAGLARLAGVCRPGAEARFVLELPSGPGELPASFATAGLRVRARPMSVEEARALPTAWAKKLGYSGHPRAFWELRSVSRTPPGGSRSGSSLSPSSPAPRRRS